MKLVEGEGWVYYEAPRTVINRPMGERNYRELLDCVAGLDLYRRVEIKKEILSINAMKRSDIHGFDVTEIFFEEPKGNEIAILTNMAVYLLNNEGKTIERLN